MALEEAIIYEGIWILKILMWQNLEFKDQEKLFMMVVEEDPYRELQNRQNTSCTFIWLGMHALRLCYSALPCNTLRSFFFGGGAD